MAIITCNYRNSHQVSQSLLEIVFQFLVFQDVKNQLGFNRIDSCLNNLNYFFINNLKRIALSFNNP